MNATAVNHVVRYVQQNRIGYSDANTCYQAYQASRPAPRYYGAMVRGYAVRSFLDHTQLLGSTLRAMRLRLSPSQCRNVVLLGGGAAPEVLGLWQHFPAYARPTALNCLNLDRHTAGWKPLADLSQTILDDCGARNWHVQHAQANFGEGSLSSKLADHSPANLAIQQFMANELPRRQRLDHYRSISAMLATGQLGAALIIESARYDHSDDLFGLSDTPNVHTLGRLRKYRMPTPFGANPHVDLRHCTSPGYSCFRNKYFIHALYLQGSCRP